MGRQSEGVLVTEAIGGGLWMEARQAVRSASGDRRTVCRQAFKGKATLVSETEISTPEIFKKLDHDDMIRVTVTSHEGV